MAIETTLVLIKPDALAKGLTGHVINRLAHAHLRIVGAKVVKVSKALAEEHYRHLKDQPFFPELIQFIQGALHGDEHSGVLALVYQGENAVSKVREIAGATHPEKAHPKSLRGQYGRITTKGVMENVLHASSDPGEGKREVALWFEPKEILQPLHQANSK